MKITRAILTGSLMWVMVFTIFALLGTIPTFHDSPVYLGLSVAIFLIPISIFGANIYYKKSPPTHGLTVALTMVATALFLDLIITIPFYEIPYNNGSYTNFLSAPLLWILIVENITILYLYGRYQLKQQQLIA
ncbi:MAG: DUF5367 domain-containing protein [Reichenbachiella sp.]